MKAIRVVAVGLFAAAVIMSQLSIDFFREWMASAPINSFVLAMKAISPEAFSGTGMGATAVIVLAFASAGLGLFLSAVLYSPLDDILAGLLRGRFVVRSAEPTSSSANCTPARVAG